MTAVSAPPVRETADISKLLKILADENRLKIIACLATGAKCVCDLTSAIDIPQNLMSHHLRVLKENGIVEGEAHGRWVFYSLRDQRLSDFLSQADLLCRCDGSSCP